MPTSNEPNRKLRREAQLKRGLEARAIVAERRRALLAAIREGFAGRVFDTHELVKFMGGNAGVLRDDLAFLWNEELVEKLGRSSWVLARGHGETAPAVAVPISVPRGDSLADRYAAWREAAGIKPPPDILEGVGQKRRGELVSGVTANEP